MVEVGPGHPLICIKSGSCFCGCSTVSKGSIYFCEEIVEDVLHRYFCDIDYCSCLTVFVLDKDHGFCASRFVPLDPNDTSLVVDEEDDINLEVNENV